jgi:hypothetical protein
MRNVSVVGVDASKELAVLRDNIANVDSTLILGLAIPTSAVEFPKVLDTIRIDFDIT